MMINMGDGLLQTDDIKARGIVDFALISLPQRKDIVHSATVQPQHFCVEGVRSPYGIEQIVVSPNCLEGSWIS